MYNLNFFAGLAVAGGVYWGLCWCSPVPGIGKSDEDEEAISKAT